MLHKRGYVVPEKMLNLSAEDFKAEFVGGGDEPNLERMSMLLFKESNELDRIYVYFAEGDVGFPQIKLCVAADEEGASVRAHARAFFPSPPHSNTTFPSSALHLPTHQPPVAAKGRGRQARNPCAAHGVQAFGPCQDGAG